MFKTRSKKFNLRILITNFLNTLALILNTHLIQVVKFKFYKNSNTRRAFNYFSFNNGYFYFIGINNYNTYVYRIKVK